MTKIIKNDKKPANTEVQNKTEPQSNSEIQKLHSEIQRLQAQAEEYLNGWKRAKADYLNREREIEKEKIAWIKFANLELILNLLPILDSFDQSVKQFAVTEIQSSQDLEIQRLREWAKGVLKIKEQLENFLKAQDIDKIKTIGEKFNPELHEATEKHGEKNEIVEEVQAGYTMHGQVIRPAKVIIK